MFDVFVSGVEGTFFFLATVTSGEFRSSLTLMELVLGCEHFHWCIGGSVSYPNPCTFDWCEMYIVKYVIMNLYIHMYIYIIYYKKNNVHIYLNHSNYLCIHDAKQASLFRLR